MMRSTKAIRTEIENLKNQLHETSGEDQHRIEGKIEALTWVVGELKGRKEYDWDRYYEIKKYLDSGLLVETIAEMQGKSKAKVKWFVKYGDDKLEAERKRERDREADIWYATIDNRKLRWLISGTNLVDDSTTRKQAIGRLLKEIEKPGGLNVGTRVYPHVLRLLQEYLGVELELTNYSTTIILKKGEQR